MTIDFLLATDCGAYPKNLPVAKERTAGDTAPYVTFQFSISS
jgi:hypothetical protein